MRQIIVVTVCAVDPAEIRRNPSGTPRIESEPQHARVYLATQADNGWLLETWAEDKPGPAEQQMRLVSDADSLAAGIAQAVQAIATDNE